MSLYRALFLTLAGLALFVQLAATASAAPTVSAATDACEQMMQMDPAMESAKDVRPDGSCEDMALDCLVAMNCFVSVATVDATGALEDRHHVRTANLVATFDALSTLSMGPESPPPIFR